MANRRGWRPWFQALPTEGAGEGLARSAFRPGAGPNQLFRGEGAGRGPAESPP